MEIFKGALRFLPLGDSLKEVHVQIPQLLHLKGERLLKRLIFSLTSVVLHSFQTYRFWGQEKLGFWISIEIETLQGVEITFLESRLEANAGQLNKYLIKSWNTEQTKILSPIWIPRRLVQKSPQAEGKSRISKSKQRSSRKGKQSPETI